ncbi:Bromodomain-containing protein 7 [Taenia crassiceps]|uniref:Bromodomain-containing protein 7 n=1 Tax=Taenia crassiceps TaxID=6207 RepID=A0ABR4QIJ5_9CEST
MESDFLSNSKSNSTRNITLESLLDAQGPKEGSQGDGSKRKTSDSGDYVIHPVPPTKRSRGQTSRAKEACLELIAILLQQDVNGFFHFSPKKAKNGDGLTTLSLRTLERFVHINKIENVRHLREYVEELFASYQHATSLSSASTPLEGGAAVVAEAARLAALARRWFESIGEDSNLMCEPLYGPSTSNDANEVTALGLLNPDNRGLVSSTERVRTIGEEVGQLSFGTHLSQNGGYREDRRNRVIPYTYLNYGPYASFGPTFDSGASNCSPEANQLLLSTSWLPARMLYSLEMREDSSVSGGGEDDCPWSRLRCVAEAEDDTELQAALADCATEWKEAREASRILDSIIPPVICGDHPDGDFKLYLANAMTRNLEKVCEITETGLPSIHEAPKTTSDQAPPMAELADTGKEAGEVKDEEAKEARVNEELLEESSRLLRDLYNAQQRRLGDFSSAALAEERSLRACGRELLTATQLAGKLVSLVGRLTRGPGDILTSSEPVRHALGLDPAAPLLTPSETIDLLS